MATTVVTKEEFPEMFELSRPEFTVGAYCECGWTAVAADKAAAEETAAVHRRHFCPFRCQ